MLNHQIIWQKWIDPFSGDGKEIDWLEKHINHEDGLDIYGQSNNIDIDEDEEAEDLPYMEDSEDINDSPKDKTHAILSPMGLIPYNEYTASSKIFNFWVGHTNFSISKPIADLIESVDGVEILDVFTRYRFRIAIGKVFEDKVVMVNINNSIYNYLDNNATS